MGEGSILVRCFNTVLYTIQQSFRNGLFIRFLLKCLGFLSVTFRDSRLYFFFCRISAFFSRMFSGSVVLHSIKDKNPEFSRWKGSVLFKIVNAVLNSPLSLGKYLYSRIQSTMEDALIIRLAKFILQYIEVIVPAVIAAILLVPDQRWYNIYTLFIAVGLVLLFAIKTVLFKDDGFTIASIDSMALLFFASAALAAFTSVNRSLSIRFVFFYLTCFLFVLLIVSITRKTESLKNFINIVTTGIFFTAIYGLWQAATGAIPFDPSLTDLDANQGMPGRIYSTLGNANNYAELLIMFLPYTIMLFLSTKNFYARAWYFITGTVMLGALGFTGARGCWGAFLVSLFVIVFFKKKSLIPVLFMLMLASVPFLPDFIVRRFMTIFNASSDSSAKTRVLIFQTVWPVLKDYWITGTGLGTDVLVKVLQRYKLELKMNVPHTHILYTQILIEMGIVGLATFVGSMVRIFRKGIANIYHHDDEFHANIIIGGLASLVGILIVCFVEHVWYYPRVMLMFWVNVAILYSAIANIKKPQPKPENYGTIAQ
ncbi:MAG: O-antigen ligase family protein [Clostridia bacterium]|nr:O-antigen ligase family protein [Clostridia bacterium]